jgi:hypothetical protein
MKVHTVASCVALFSAGCGASLEQLRNRASVDLGCQASNVAVHPIDAATMSASGCGKQAIYVEQFNDSRHSTWLLNSAIASAAPSGP